MIILYLPRQLGLESRQRRAPPLDIVARHVGTRLPVTVLSALLITLQGATHNASYASDMSAFVRKVASLIDEPACFIKVRVGLLLVPRGGTLVNEEPAQSSATGG